MPAPQEIVELVARFRRNLKDYQSGKYNETQARLEFIDPFFEALGWDMHNKKGYAEAYKDVVHEDQVKVGGATKAPDYGFRIGGTRKFFVEAKKPSVNIKDDVHPAYQLRRYAWSAKLPLSILTDFEELAVYDCRIRPVKTDKTGTARVMYFTFDEYAEKWDEIAAVFAREAVLQGSFDRYAESKLGKRGTAEVDVAFLAEIERWRETLARNIALRNPGLTVRDLNFAVQRTIDRIIFLRIAEDRGLEPYGQLRNIGEQQNSYVELCRLYLRADERYNSGLFHFKTEKDRSGEPDAFTVKLHLDEKVIDSILKNLYYPDSPYEFSVLPVDILGQVYEQFLGKVIRLTTGGQAKVEDKPEVKKAGGVYYTPTYIVDYIVQQTVGKLLEGRTPNNATELKICDPACGSGSFLLGAFQVLLSWHRDFYVSDDPEKWAKTQGRRAQTLWQGPGGEWHLTTAEKRRILLNNIYGVDIDPQAVEVTKLSLLLKVLEGENEGSLGQQMAFFQERALPDLDSNIKCGNSLIGPDFYTGQQLTMGLSPLSSLRPLSIEEMHRINAFDWKQEFPGVFDAPPRFLWFVTFVTHNSRVSERMVTYGVKRGEPVIFNAEERLVMLENIIETCQKHSIPIVNLNVLPDHVHMIIPAYDETELNEFVRKIKGGSSFVFQRAVDWSKGNQVWAQKFHRKPITDEQALHQIMEYIENNALKHAQSWGDELISGWDKGLKPLVHTARVRPEEAIQVRGGFDAIIGNPPYIRIQALKEWAPKEVEFYKQAYVSASKGNYDIYVVFVEKGLQLLNQNGLLGYILPHKFFNAKYGESLRGLVAEGKYLSKVVHFGDQQVFNGAITYTCILLLSKKANDVFFFTQVSDLIDWRVTYKATNGYIETANANIYEWNFIVGPNAKLFDKLSSMPVKLGKLAERIAQGIRTSGNDVYVVDFVEENDNTIIVTSKSLEQNIIVEKEIVSWFLQGRDIKRYQILHSGKMVIIPYRVDNGKVTLISLPDIKNEFPHTYEYLCANKGFLENRERGRMKGPDWHAYIYPKNIDFMSQPKILVPDIADKAQFAFDQFGQFTLTSGYGITIRKELQLSPKYILGLLNSRVLDFYLKCISTPMQNGFFRYFTQFIERLPIRTIDFDNPAEAVQHDRMVALVEAMLGLHRQLAAAKSPTEKQMFQRQIETTDRQIDVLVYQLYDLTEEEIKIVENAQ